VTGTRVHRKPKVCFGGLLADVGLLRIAVGVRAGPTIAYTVIQGHGSRQDVEHPRFDRRFRGPACGQQEADDGPNDPDHCPLVE